MYPKYTINKVNPSISVVGSIDRLKQGRENWIGDNYLGFLYKNNTLFYGRWLKEGEKWRFSFKESKLSTASFVAGEVVNVLDGYWGERVDLVISADFNWALQTFKAKDNCDHEHCKICWATISETENTNYYCSSGAHPICKKCHNNHVSTKDLSFVPENV